MFKKIVILCLFLSVIDGFQVKSDQQAGALTGLRSIAYSIPKYVKSFFQTKQEVDDIQDKQNSIQDALDALMKVENTTNHQVEHAQERVVADYQNCSDTIQSLNCINLPIWQVQKDKHISNSSIIQQDIQQNQEKVNQIKDLIGDLMQEQREKFQKIEPNLKKVNKNIDVLNEIIKMVEQNFNLTTSLAQLTNFVVFPYPETYSFLQSQVTMLSSEQLDSKLSQDQQQNLTESSQENVPNPQQQVQTPIEQSQQEISSLEKPKIDQKTFQLFQDQLAQLEVMRDTLSQQKNDIQDDINNRKSQFEQDLQNILNINQDLREQLLEKKQQINELEQQINDCNYEKQLNQYCEDQKNIQQDFLESLVQEQALIQSAIDETNILINQAIQEQQEAAASAQAEPAAADTGATTGP